MARKIHIGGLPETLNFNIKDAEHLKEKSMKGLYRIIKDTRGFSTHHSDNLFALALIGILVAIAIPNYLSYKKKAEVKEAIQHFERVKTAITSYAKSQIQSIGEKEKELRLKDIVDKINKNADVKEKDQQIVQLLKEITTASDHWKYYIEAGLAGENTGRNIEFCVIAKEKDEKEKDARYILYSSKSTDKTGWEQHVNKVSFKDDELPVQGGYCNPDGSFNPNFR